MSIAQPGGIAPASSSRRPVAQLATGGFLLLAGALFEAPFLLSSRAQQFDDFFTNLFLAPLFALVGSVFYLLALRRLGLSLAPLLALFLISLVAVTGIAWVPVSTPQRFLLIVALVMADAALLFIVGALVARARGLLGVWTQGLVLALVAAAALTVIYYFFGGQVLVFYELKPSLPPYLNGVTLGATAALAALAYLFGWRWKPRAQ
jgi:hypothetical protein